ncbi:MAG: HTTM domain-containing protein [Hymenobacteraceae bacterium]|nr:HTTM domain-containing protein [Hymenobacteraceae bacterium]MDX5396233.1 HTTM domain-containing protein [Hymenobacteraceae bacterium]MDX5442848.1 HTTM domain-containing protein [Hymenobacteraceae bacterium]MDX5512296.1 HTTM domain-containing protein [Hymenobacteraceae bacterium]
MSSLSKPFNKLNGLLHQPVHIAPLVVFRIIFGTMMLGSTIRFAWNGWIDALYIQPKFYFTYFGFEWVKPLGETGMYLLFALMAVSALGILLGSFYRLSSLLFFLSFTYVELIDKSNYLNHYYFVSLVALLMVFVPAHRAFSVDVWRKPQLQLSHVPRWTILIFQVQLGLVYFYAGLAKLNYDWLFRAMPLRIWLPANAHLPLIGWLFDYAWVAFAFSWFGAVYDLFIPFALAWRKTRWAAYFFVIAFHVLTRVLFQIGMFPFIMILATLIFFSEDFHKNILKTLRSWLMQTGISVQQISDTRFSAGFPKNSLKMLTTSAIAVFLLFQVLFPWRFLLYPGKLFWTEQGYRFSWRVMLMEKAGTAFFYVKDPETGFQTEINNCDYLTANQEKMMATQPDMILQFAHFLKKEYQQKGYTNPEVRAQSYVTLNGSGSRPFIDATVDLAKETDTFKPKTWILPFSETPAALAAE